MYYSSYDEDGAGGRTSSEGADDDNGGGMSTVFSVASARSMLFGRFPAKLQQQIAYRHFYTDEFQKSDSLSLQFFSLLISYFCSLFRLEGRRREYLKNAQSEKLGVEFANAHRRAQYIFKRVTGVYAQIVTTYTVHSVLELPRAPRPQDLTRQKLPQNVHAKQPPLVQRIPAFLYAADELQFYEELLVFTTELMRVAFSDEKLRQPIGEEIARLFRSRSFSFATQRREAVVAQTAAVMSKNQTGIRSNVRLLAETLVPQPAHVQMKYALRQSTPLMGSRLTTGPMASLRYQRPAFLAEKMKPSVFAQRLQDSFVIETHTPGFPSWHRAIASAEQRSPTTRSPLRSPRRAMSQCSTGSGGSERNNAWAPPTGVSPRRTPQGTHASAVHPQPQHGTTATAAAAPHEEIQLHRAIHLIPKLPYDYDAALGALSGGHSMQLGGSGANVLNGSSGDVGVTPFAVPEEAVAPPSALKSAVNNSSGGGSPSADGKRPPTSDVATRLRKSINTVRHSVSLAAAGAYHGATKAALFSASSRQPLDVPQIVSVDPATGREDWLRYDAGPEIDSVYQSMANGVVVSSFSIPVDILIHYDQTGVLSTGPL